MHKDFRGFGNLSPDPNFRPDPDPHPYSINMCFSKARGLKKNYVMTVVQN